MALAVLIGGSGFIGRYAAQRFARAGWRVRVAVRRPNEALALRTYGNVGQVEPVQANIRDEASMRAAIEGADVVVNLVGLLGEFGKQRFDAVHVEGAERAARLAKAAGAKRFIQISAIGADAESESDYARTKAEAEARVRAGFPGATILRPSIVFGPEDQFFNRFAAMARMTPVLPVVGAATKFQPVYVDDVAAAIVAAATSAEAEGQTYELGGPRVYSFAELMKEMLRVVKRRRLLLPVPFWIASLKASAFGLIPILTLGLAPNTILTRDQVKLLKVDNVAGEGAPGLAELGVTPTTVEAVIPSYLYRFRPHGQYEEAFEQA